MNDLNRLLDMLEIAGFDVYQGVTIYGPTMSEVLEDFLYDHDLYVYNNGYDAGYDTGHEEGYNIGYDEGEHEGTQVGHDVGFTSGFEEGYEHGYEIAKYGTEW